MNQKAVLFRKARLNLHSTLLSSILTLEKGVPSNADKHNLPSVAIAKGIVTRLGEEVSGIRSAGQTSGNKFEHVCEQFLKDTFIQLDHLRPGKWDIECVRNKNRLEIAKYEQYSHLIAVSSAAKKNSALAAALGSDYTITPDIIIFRNTEEDSEINRKAALIDSGVATHSSLRKSYNPLPILHASISCKWTIRSDRAQNSRSEALNLIRNRKGPLPHIAVITGEPLPSRISSVALGTGDINCVYHFALHELKETLDELEFADAKELLQIMIEGKRLKDISDLPLDLAI